MVKGLIMCRCVSKIGANRITTLPRFSFLFMNEYKGQTAKMAQELQPTKGYQRCTKVGSQRGDGDVRKGGLQSYRGGIH